MDPTDQTLVNAARRGDPEALEALLERYAPAVYRFGVKMCGNPEDAKDVLQETLIAAVRGLREFRGDASLATWLYAVARSFCAKKHRVSKFAPASTMSLEERGAADTPAAGPMPEEVVANRELAELLDRELDSLEPSYREVLLGLCCCPRVVRRVRKRHVWRDTFGFRLAARFDRRGLGNQRLECASRRRQLERCSVRHRLRLEPHEPDLRSAGAGSSRPVLDRQ